jgi:hypothetical protein
LLKCGLLKKIDIFARKLMGNIAQVILDEFHEIRNHSSGFEISNE